MGSQAIVGLFRPCFCWFWSTTGGLALPVSITAGTRSSTDVSARSLSRIDTVRVGAAAGLRSAIRSALAARLTTSPGLFGNGLPAAGEIVAEGQLGGAQAGGKRGGDRGAQKCFVNL